MPYSPPTSKVNIYDVPPKNLFMNKGTITLLALLLCCFTLQLQAKSTFIRVFGLNGKLLAKGDLVATTDTSVIVQRHKQQVEIAVTKIGLIKTGVPIGR